ncbi:MAG TPA: hypothetical protein VHW24_23610 [Bryobacteraceae bacterium]|nr:hypothetical protein [Bryobacteraceae bacterium]
MNFRSRLTCGAGALAVIALIAMCAAGPVNAQRSKKATSHAAASFSYYMLVMSYGPNYCQENPSGAKQDPAECGAGTSVGFVVHGLWPENDTSEGPQKCGSSTVPQAVVNATLPYMTSASLIQHEWSTHGSCSGLNVTDFFATLRKARDSVKIPAQLQKPTQKLTLTPLAIETQMAGANPSFGQTAFRVSCYRDNNLEEVRVCMSKGLMPQACTSSAGMCPAKSVTLLPVR